MKQTYDDCPGWGFEVDEVSVGVYQVRATDAQGRRVETKGFDPDLLIAEVKRDALAMSARAEAPASAPAANKVRAPKPK